MRNTIQTFGALVLILTGIAASAQSPHQMNVNVPFSFTAAGTIHVPGEYRLSLDPTTSVLTMTKGSSTTVILMTSPGDSNQGDQNFLAFYGDQHILREVSIAGIRRRVPLARARRLIAAPDAGSVGATVSQAGNPSQGGEN